MRKKQWVVGILLAVSCLVFVGCGKSETVEVESVAETSIEEENNDVGEVTEEKEEAKEEVESVQDKYKALAEEYILLQEQYSDLYSEYAYYESMRLSQSAEGFSMKKDGMFFSHLEGTTAETQITEIENIDIQGLEYYKEQEKTIPELGDEEAEKRITELETKNEELKADIANLQNQIEILRGQWASE